MGGPGKMFRLRPKEHHSALPMHPGKQLEDRPPQQVVRHSGSCIIAPITNGSCNNPPFYRGTTRHRKWARRATPPLCHRIDESLLTYAAASHPRTRGALPRPLHILFVSKTRDQHFWTDDFTAKRGDRQ
ncbi:hypothetical protein AVEN_240807-1 [Araneus ventricosus]|uniref:Uncharacterized protein n=1 Tax=Araneus ventricosus TaxID=182803 RepID=A0A4Y2AS12_ARAVE|nr:hypothetical protein AVEN_240807-1 [Araneus ventricosus]